MEIMPIISASLLRLNIDFNGVPDSLVENTDDLMIKIDGDFFIPKETANPDYNRLFITITTYPSSETPYFSQVAFEIPRDLINEIIEFDHVFVVPKDEIDQKINKYFCISLSVSSKHDGEMGISASIGAGTFFSNYFPISLHRSIEGEDNE